MGAQASLPNLPIEIDNGISVIHFFFFSLSRKILVIIKLVEISIFYLE